MSITIKYLGKTYTTDLRKELSDEQYKKVVEDYYRKPDFDDVKQQMLKLYMGGVKTNHIYNYYIKDLAIKTKLYHSKWSIEEVLNYKPLLEVFYGKTEANKKVYPDNLSISEKIATAFRLCGKGLAEKPANFPLKSCNEILKKYNVNNRFYDYSCGWGIRLLSALSNGIDYFGTDPNYLLCDRLYKMSYDFKNICNASSIVDIRKHGSEIFVEEWRNQFGIAFSSPPYYNLEDYRIGNQSYKIGMAYKQWLDGFMYQTIKNIYEYLIDDGYFIINIKNYQKYHLIEDVLSICERIGFTLYAKEILENNKRVGIANNSTNEDIFVFTKKIKQNNA